MAKKKGRPKKTSPPDTSGSAPKFEHWDRACADGIFFLIEFEKTFLDKDSYHQGKVLFCQESLKNPEVIHPERPSSENVEIFARLKPGHVAYSQHEKGWEHKNLARNINTLAKAYVKFKETGKGMSVYSAFVQSCSHTPSNTVVLCLEITGLSRSLANKANLSPSIGNEDRPGGLNIRPGSNPDYIPQDIHVNLGEGNLADLQEEDEEQNPPNNNKPSDEEEEEEDPFPFAEEEEEDYDITLGEDTPTPNKSPAFDFSGETDEEEEDFDDDTIVTLKQIKMDNKSQATSRSNHAANTTAVTVNEGGQNKEAVYRYDPEHHYLNERSTNDGEKHGYMAVCSLPSDVYLNDINVFLESKKRGKKKFLVIRWRAPIDGYNQNRYLVEPKQAQGLTYQEYEDLVTRYRILKKMMSDGLEEKGYSKPGQVVYCQVVFDLPSDGPELDPRDPFVDVHWRKTSDPVEVLPSQLDESGEHTYPTVLVATYLECVTKKGLKAPHEQQVKRTIIPGGATPAKWQKPPSNEVYLVPKKRTSFNSAEFQDARTAPSHYNEEHPPTTPPSKEESLIFMSQMNSHQKRFEMIEARMAAKDDLIANLQQQLSTITLANGHNSPTRVRPTGGDKDDGGTDTSKKTKRHRVQTDFHQHSNIVDEDGESYQDPYEDGDLRLMSPRNRKEPIRMRMRGGPSHY